ncbi:hypothetical protein HGRIS_003124 [Hohenbuehelia grisea]|uniref:Trafficking protein particle complex II-specific subunit 65 IgD3 domain-containing protein n=1 Tax=Hohenbuehelia grisea TaxID=104357 RepID=A0ABR3JNZ7_9AGAR
MADFEALFGSSVLQVSTPDTTIQFPPDRPADEWLTLVKSGEKERNQAFFDEQLHALLTVRIKNPGIELPEDPDSPPSDLLSFLSHLQITLEATYISPVPEAPESPAFDTTRLSAPPRPGTAGLKLNPRSSVRHPPIFPPSTPNPTPLTAENDRKYVQAEGTLLLASIWGQNPGEAFCLVWSPTEEVWVAVYRLSLTISFIRLKFDDPLLCLTVSATLRDKPLVLNNPNHPLVEFLASRPGLPSSSEQALPTPTSKSGQAEHEELWGLDEVNLLEGLACGPTFQTLASEEADEENSPLQLSTSRLGIVSRRKLFSLPPLSLPSPARPSPSPITALRTAHPTLRKSFRRTLQTASGFRVRMRTVFVPCVMLDDESIATAPPSVIQSPEISGLSRDDNDEDDNDVEAEEERERREAGNEERTVILCVEIENSGDSGPDVAIDVRNVDVAIGGDGAKTRLIGWGDEATAADASEKMFPLRIEPMGQFNLLYAVSFLKAPEEMDGFSLARDPGMAAAHNPELQRAVTITIHGQPVVAYRGEDAVPIYPTETFPSRWNCVLDLSASVHQELTNAHAASEEAANRARDTLPEPPSPFPVMGPRSPRRNSAMPSFSSGMASFSAGVAKRHSLPAGAVGAGISIKSASSTRSWRASTSLLKPSFPSTREQGGGAQARHSSYIPPSLATQPARSPTTYNLPLAPGSPYGDSPPTPDGLPNPPQTPAYPSYPSPSALSPQPPSQAPIASHSTGHVGPRVEVKRDRGSGVPGLGLNISGGGGGSQPNTPLPLVPGAFGEQGMLQQIQKADEGGETLVISIGMLPVPSPARRKTGKGDALSLGPAKIYPLDTFTLDIFVFNQSNWTRRLEVSFPDQRTIRKGAAARDQAGMGEPGILALSNRVRIGPLRPLTCQSVRMEFLALAPGVHAIDILTLTDVETGASKNLRTVMDVVVHEMFD